jgi:hypothetical protein
MRANSIADRNDVNMVRTFAEVDEERPTSSVISLSAISRNLI